MTFLQFTCRMQGCVFMGVHNIIVQWLNSVLLLGETNALKLHVKKLWMHVELKISMTEQTTLGILEIWLNSYLLSEMGNIFSFSYLISLFSTILWIRTACVIAVAKARDTFEPFLHQVSWCLLLFTPLGGSTCNLLLQMIYTTNFGIIPNPFLLLLLSASYLFWGAA